MIAEKLSGKILHMHRITFWDVKKPEMLPIASAQKKTHLRKSIQRPNLETGGRNRSLEAEEKVMFK